MSNLQYADRRTKENSDMQTTLKLVKEIQLKNPGFHYIMRADKTNIVRSIFWTDARSKLDYALFGDFVSFDTTFSTNRYDMPFAPIVGINNHGKTIIFGCALLENQTADTFRWLLSTFLEAMGGKRPSIVITDQDIAMKKAIEEVLPEVIHRNCKFHVMRNCKKYCGAFIEANKPMGKQLCELIDYSLSEEEFENGWKQLKMLTSSKCLLQEKSGCQCTLLTTSAH